MANYERVSQAAQSDAVSNAAEMRITVFDTDGAVIARLTTDTSPVQYQGNTYTPYPIKIAPPSDPEKGDPQIAAEIGYGYDGGELLKIINSFDSKTNLTCNVQVFPRDEPDIADFEMNLEVIGVVNRGTAVQVTLGFNRVLTAPLMKYRFTKTRAPGLYA